MSLFNQKDVPTTPSIKVKDNDNDNKPKETILCHAETQQLIIEYLFYKYGIFLDVGDSNELYSYIDFRKDFVEICETLDYIDGFIDSPSINVQTGIRNILDGLYRRYVDSLKKTIVHNCANAYLSNMNSISIDSGEYFLQFMDKFIPTALLEDLSEDFFKECYMETNSRIDGAKRSALSKIFELESEIVAKQKEIERIKQMYNI